MLQGPDPMGALPVEEFFPFGKANGDNKTPQGDDANSGSIYLTVDFRYFGKEHNKLFVSTKFYLSTNLYIF